MPRWDELNVSFDEDWKKSNLRERSSEVEEIIDDLFEWYLRDVSLGKLANGGVACGGSEEGIFRCYDMKGKIWEKQYFRAVYSTLIADINNDGKNEVLAAGCESKLFVMDADGNEIFTFPIKKWIYKIAVGDINNDGKPEILFSSRDRKLRAVNSQGNLLWEQDFGEGHVRYIKVGDVNGDGKNEVVATTHDAFLYVLNGATGEKIWDFEFEIDVTAGLEMKKYTPLELADITGDGKQEILAGAEDGEFKVLDGSGTDLFTYDFDGPVYDIYVGNGMIVVGAEPKIVKDKAVEGTKSLVAFDLKFKEKFTVTYDGGVYFVVGGDINGDGKDELVLGTGIMSVRALDLEGNEKWVYMLDNYVRALDVKDIDDDGKAEILVGGRDKSLRLLKAVF